MSTTGSIRLDGRSLTLADVAAVAHELGDLLFTTVNLGRHLGVDAHASLHHAIGRVEARIRLMEEHGALEGVPLVELEKRWQAAKRELGTD